MTGVTRLFASLLMALGLISPAAADSGREPGWHERSIDIGETTRWYRLYVPNALEEDAPLVVLLHVGGGSMRQMFFSGTGGEEHWQELAQAEKFLLLTPNGVSLETGDARGDFQRWADVRGPDSSVFTGADDVSFVMQLVDQVEKAYGTDPDRVYLTGGSNGGMMIFRLLIEQPDRFAAAAAFIANMAAESPLVREPAEPTPLMIMNGTEDPVLPFDGGALSGGRGPILSTPETIAWWADANRADTDKTTTAMLPDRDPGDGCRIERTLYPATAEAAPVEAYVMKGGGHTMPSIAHPIPGDPLLGSMLGRQCRDAEGAELAWRFLSRYER
ncbi:MAG: alpha/beta hydrolase family esterase [Geminicoccaceae bacterium]